MHRRLGRWTGNSSPASGVRISQLFPGIKSLSTCDEAMNCAIQVHWAVRKRQTDILRRLISRGWLVDETGRNGDTPVCLAAEDCSAETCECISMLCVAGVRIKYVLYALILTLHVLFVHSPQPWRRKRRCSPVARSRSKPCGDCESAAHRRRKPRDTAPRDKSYCHSSVISLFALSVMFFDTPCT
jgi:hypothetical protein